MTPGPTVVLGKATPAESIDMVVPSTMIVVAGAFSPILYVVPEIMATVGPIEKVKPLTTVTIVEVATAEVRA